MASTLNLETQDLMADTLRKADVSLPIREWLTELAFSVGFVAASVALWAVHPPHRFAPVAAGLCLLLLILATQVRFDTPFGFTVATQLAFVPLLFAIPLATVPLAVAGCLMIGRLPATLAGKYPPNRLIKEFGNAWFAVGPVAVFALTGTAPDKAGAALLITALLAQFGVDFAASTLRYRIERGASLSSQLSETWVYAIDAALSGIALVVAEDIHRTSLVVLAPLPLLALLAGFARERHQRMESLIELNAAYRGTALALGDVVEADDGYTGEHSKGVVQLAQAVGQELRLDTKRRRNLEFGALLHDVGKIATPKAIINKPGKLDPDEWKTMTRHTVEGQRMLDRVGGFMHGVGLIVRSHHERWDGGGYPDGLAGEEIPLEDRIITCCDSWNAMRTDRVYRKALPFEVAKTELIVNSGRQFDPHIVDAFLRVIDAESSSGQAPRAAQSLSPASS